MLLNFNTAMSRIHMNLQSLNFNLDLEFEGWIPLFIQVTKSAYLLILVMPFNISDLVFYLKYVFIPTIEWVQGWSQQLRNGFSSSLGHHFPNPTQSSLQPPSLPKSSQPIGGNTTQYSPTQEANVASWLWGPTLTQIPPSIPLTQCWLRHSLPTTPSTHLFGAEAEHQVVLASAWVPLPYHHH